MMMRRAGGGDAVVDVVNAEETSGVDLLPPTRPNNACESRSLVDLMHTDALEKSHLYLSGGGGCERLYLPRRGSHPSLDEYLRGIPRVVSRASELTADGRGIGTTAAAAAAAGARCLNVLQGEVAHATSLQADCLVSADATTCHVVALRSSSGAAACSNITSASVVPPLCSLAHIDKDYDSCLEAMVVEHLHYHETKRSAAAIAKVVDDDSFGFFVDEEEYQVPLNDFAAKVNESSAGFLPLPLERRKTRNASLPDLHKELIEMELHMVGGFLDKDGASQRLSTALVERFSDLAAKYESRGLRISLSTAAVSCLNNDDDRGGPVHRGLGMDTRTGRVFAIQDVLPTHLQGPAVEIRSARAAFGHGPSASLSVIHTARSDCLRVEPFSYRADPHLSALLLNFSDAMLLRVASTSPDQESDNFCTNFRRTVSFVSTVPPETVFGHQGRTQPLVYSRSSTCLNEWVVV